MHVIDASVWVSQFVEEDVHHQKSLRWLEHRIAVEDPILLPALVLAEVAGAISRRTGGSGRGHRASNLVEQLPNTRLISIDIDLARLGATVAADASLSGADALYVALAQTFEVPLVTWNRQQLSRGGALTQVVTPTAA